MMRLPLLLLVLALPACGGSCTEGPSDAGPVEAQGVLRVIIPVGGSVEEGSLQVRLAELAAPLRAVQVDMQLSGAQAVEAGPAGQVAHDVIEANLSQPRSTLTLVVSDSRRIPLTDGPIAALETDRAVSEVVLSRALGIDADGQRVELAVEVE